MELKELDVFEAEVATAGVLVDDLLGFLGETIVGQEALLERIIIGLLADGHILLEGLPGLAKTLAVKTLAHTIDAKFSRIQFTPDILPADILGTMIYNINTNEFNIKKGPIFANFILADEINRAPEKVQSALLEVMQEHQVTIGSTTFFLDPPFMVLATQNPVDQNGTYELPEAQMDRFMMKVIITYPSLEQERLIIRKNINETSDREPPFTIHQIHHLRSIVNKIHIDTKIEDYILHLVFCTRFPENYSLGHLKGYIRYGSSPRGSINLARTARAYAFFKKRIFVIPEDIKAVVFDVLRHRIGLTYSAIAGNVTADDILMQILQAVPMP
jgi:MoxR-like ATPase